MYIYTVCIHLYTSKADNIIDLSHEQGDKVKSKLWIEGNEKVLNKK